ncbi:MAG: hypothetical protein IJY78_08210 [Bacteroidaceae bacterium]|nr:hypothetical protein [Bacteroidaceae bacterium]
MEYLFAALGGIAIGIVTAIVFYDLQEESQNLEAVDSDVLYERALAVYGERLQITVAIEEMSELQKELCKHIRGKDVHEGVAEEMADVYIMLEQLIGIFGNAKAVERYKQIKKARLWNRVLGREKKHD